jgi:hypothetical protein
MKVLGALLSLLLASGAQAQSLKAGLSEERFEKPSGNECVISRGHDISRSIRLRHQRNKHRKRPREAPTPTSKPRPPYDPPVGVMPMQWKDDTAL